jgi:acetyl-CoA acetyltransferase
MSDVYVLGVDMIKFGRFPDRTVPNIGAEAALMALDDAGLTIKICKLCIVETLVKQMQWLDKEFFKR